MQRFLTRPLYLQVRDTLVVRNVTRQWAPGLTIPNELDLARELGASPGTVRKALDLLEAMRLVTRRQGRGTTVNDLASGNHVTSYSNLRTASWALISKDVTGGEVIEVTPNEVECAPLSTAAADKARGRQDSTTSQPDTFVCRHCGLSLTLKKHPNGPVLGYDHAEWRRRCRFRDHPSPAWCVSER